VSWDARLVPNEATLPQARAPKQTSAPKALGPMVDEATQTFIALHRKMLVGMISNGWSRIVLASPKLARDPLAEQLVPLIEAALDMAKTGEDAAHVRYRFESIMAQVGPPGDVNVLNPLRDRVPLPKKPEIDRWVCDPHLDMREHPQWHDEYAHGLDILHKYNVALAKAIKQDEAAGLKEKDPKSSSSESEDGPEVAVKRWRDRQTSKCDQVKAKFVESYFSGETDADLQTELVRASAWYSIAYTKRKQSFAWLGIRALMRIKTLRLHGKGEPVSVGPLNTPLDPIVTDAAGDSLRTSVALNRGRRATRVLPSSESSTGEAETLVSFATSCMQRRHKFSLNAGNEMRTFVCEDCEVSYAEQFSRQHNRWIVTM